MAYKEKAPASTGAGSIIVKRRKKSKRKTARRARPLLAEPITPTRGSWIAPAAKDTQIPLDFPLYYPSELEERTAVIRTKALKKYPKQNQILELCRDFITEMTPLLCDAVKAGTMRAGQALGDSGMSGLINSLLGYNCKDSDEKYRLEQEVRRSDEWSEFEKVIAEAEDNSAQGVGHTNAATGNRRGKILKPMLAEKGLSVHGWAVKAGVDFHTANDYLTGKTKPYLDTLKNLADALGVEVTKLPE